MIKRTDNWFLTYLSDDAIAGFVYTCRHNNLPINNNTVNKLVMEELCLSIYRSRWRTPWVGELVNVILEDYIKGNKDVNTNSTMRQVGGRLTFNELGRYT